MEWNVPTAAFIIIYFFFTVAARQFDRKLTEKQFEMEMQKWLRYAHERSGGVPRKEMPKT